MVSLLQSILKILKNKIKYECFDYDSKKNNFLL